MVGRGVLAQTSLNVFLKVLGSVPTISINKTEGCQVYLSRESLRCDIVSARSSEMNILIPQEDEFVSVGESRLLPLAARARPAFKLSMFCSAERVSGSRTIQDRLGRLQTGHRTHRDRRLAA